MAKVFKITCRECGADAKIQRTDKQHPDFYALYCVCKNPTCGHTWVSNYTFSHSLRASKLDRDGLVNYLISKLPRTELERLSQSIKQQLTPNI